MFRMVFWVQWIVDCVTVEYCIECCATNVKQPLDTFLFTLHFPPLTLNSKKYYVLRLNKLCFVFFIFFVCTFFLKRSSLLFLLLFVLLIIFKCCGWMTVDCWDLMIVFKTVIPTKWMLITFHFITIYPTIHIRFDAIELLYEIWNRLQVFQSERPNTASKIKNCKLKEARKMAIEYLAISGD